MSNDRTMKRRTLVKASLAGAGATVLLARHGRANAEKPQYGGTLRVAYQRVRGAMNSPTAVTKMGADYIFKPGSTGPFKVAGCVSGSHVRFVRNENYCDCDAAGNVLLYR